MSSLSRSSATYRLRLWLLRALVQESFYEIGVEQQLAVSLDMREAVFLGLSAEPGRCHPQAAGHRAEW